MAFIAPASAVALFRRRMAAHPPAGTFIPPAWVLALLLRRGAPSASQPLPFIVELLTFLGNAIPGVSVYPGHLPRSGVSFPAVVYNKIHAGRWTRLSGPSGRALVRYQLDCYDADDFAALTADDQIRRALQPFAGMMGSVRVRECNLEDQASEYDDPADSSDDGTYRHRSEWLFIYDEPS